MSTNLQPGDSILCDPEFSPEQYAEGRTPNCIVPAQVIFTDKVNDMEVVKVAIINPPTEKYLTVSNTDLYGETCFVLLTAIQKRAA